MFVEVDPGVLEPPLQIGHRGLRGVHAILLSPERLLPITPGSFFRRSKNAGAAFGVTVMSSRDRRAIALIDLTAEVRQFLIDALLQLVERVSELVLRNAAGLLLGDFEGGYPFRRHGTIVSNRGLNREVTGRSRAGHRV